MVCVTKCMVIYKIEWYLACEEGCMLFIAQKWRKAYIPCYIHTSYIHRMSNDTFLFGSENPEQRLSASGIIRIFKMKGLAWVLKWILFDLQNRWRGGQESERNLRPYQTLKFEIRVPERTSIRFWLFCMESMPSKQQPWSIQWRRNIGYCVEVNLYSACKGQRWPIM